MSDDCHDSTASKHAKKRDAGSASNQYFQEKRKGLELQSQRLRAAELAARQAEMPRLEQEKAEQAHLKSEQAFLLELKAQGRRAQKHRDWERLVLFLKESDEAARLDTFFEILIKRLDLPTAGMETEDFPEWSKEHDEALSFIYLEPDLPEKCGPSGALTEDIRRLTSSLLKSAVNLTPPGVTRYLRPEIEEVPAVITKLSLARRWLRGWFAAYLSISVCFFILLVACCLELFGVSQLDQPYRSGSNPAIATMITKALILAGGAFGTLFVTIILGLRRMRKEAEFQTCHREHQVRKTNVAREVARLQAEASQAYEHTISEAVNTRWRLSRELAEAVRQWRSTVRVELVKDFFEQGLWINAGFKERLKALLAEIQRPFPTSCRVEIKELHDDQVESAFRVLTAVVASKIADKVDLGRSGTLAQLIVSGTEPGVSTPSATVVLEKLERERILLKGDQLGDDTASCMTEVLETLRA